MKKIMRFVQAIPDQNKDSYIRGNKNGLKYSFGFATPVFGTGMYGGFEFSFNITNFGRSIFDRKYREDLYKSVVQAEKEKFVQDIAKRGYLNTCQ